MISLCPVRSLRIPLPSAFAVTVASLLLLTASAPQARGDAARGTGAVAGKVVDKDGNAVAGAKVRLASAVGGGQKNRKAGQRQRDKAPRGAAAGRVEAAGEAPVVLVGKRNRAGGNKGAAKGGRGAVAQAVSENDGTFRMGDVPAGRYSITARSKGHGVARQSVKVKHGETATVNLSLRERQPKAGKGKAGAGGKGAARKQGGARKRDAA